MVQIWKCSGNDIRTMPPHLWEKNLSILSNPKEMEESLLSWRALENRKEIVLPLVQNLEGAVLGAGVIKRENYWTTGNYPFSTLKEIGQTLTKKGANYICPIVIAKTIGGTD